jgi:AmpD protein
MSMAEPARLPPGYWSNGWYAFAHACTSPNFGARPADACVDLVVLHSISLPPGEFGGDAVQRLFTNRLDWNAHPYFKQIEGLLVSAHFFISRGGELWQFVSCDDRAWHAGRSQFQGRDNCNDYSIGIELEGLEGGDFEDAQYESLISLLPALASQYPVRHITGHEHVAPGRKSDPGPGMDWVRLHSAMGLGSQYFPDSEKKIQPV